MLVDEQSAVGMQNCEITSIGIVSGLVWCHLSEQGPTTPSKLAREIGAPRDLVMQGVGWLAREGKVTFEKGACSKKIVLT